MSNPRDPQYPVHPQQPGQNPGPTQPNVRPGTQALTSDSFPPSAPGYPGAQPGYPSAQPGYPSEHARQQGYVGGPYGQNPQKQKKPLLKRWWFWLIVIVVVIAMFSALGGGGDDTNAEAGASSQEEKAGGEQPKDDKAPADGKPADAAAEKPAYGIGDAVEADGWEITVGEVKDGVASVGDEYLGAEAQGQFVTVELSVKNTESEPDYFFEDNIKLGDDTGNTYSADSEAGLYVDENSLLFLEEINPGNTATGVLVFDVPKDVSPDRLTFEGGMFSDPVEISLK